MTIKSLSDIYSECDINMSYTNINYSDPQHMVKNDDLPFIQLDGNVSFESMDYRFSESATYTQYDNAQTNMSSPAQSILSLLLNGYQDLLRLHGPPQLEKSVTQVRMLYQHHSYQ